MNNFWKNKKVLITGHTGFKGSWLSLFLYVLGAELYGISKTKNEGIYKLAKIKTLFKMEYFFDLGRIDTNKLSNYLEEIQPEIIFHLAAQAIVSVGNEDPIDTFNSNVLGSINLLKSASDTGICKSIIVSTTDKVYKNNQIYNHENSELGGKDFYSLSKVVVENIIDIFKNQNINKNKLVISTVRSGNVLGGGDRGKDRLSHDIINSFFNKQTLYIRNLKSIRPWQYILDSIFGYILVAEYNYIYNSHQVFNLNSKINNKYTVEYIIKEFEKNFDYNFNIKTSKKIFNENKILKLNSDKARNQLNWNTETNIKTTISNIVSWEVFHKKKQSTEYSINEILNFIKSNQLNYELNLSDTIF